MNKSDSPPKLSISIAHLGGAEMLRGCLASIPAATANTECEIWVVDNQSDDGSIEMISSQFPMANRIELRTRYGFAANHNLGQSRSSADYVCILNNDTILEPAALDRLVEFLETNRDVGIVAPMVWNPDQTPQPSCGPFVSLRSELVANLLPSRWVSRAVAHRKACGVCYPDWVGGVCLMTRREIWDSLHGLDEGYYIFFEETDFCRRASNTGWKVAHVLDAALIHFGGQNTGEGWMHASKFLIYCNSQIRYFRKHHRRWELISLRAFSAMAFLVKVIAWKAIAMIPRRREWATAHARVFSQAARVEMGLDG